MSSRISCIERNPETDEIALIDSVPSPKRKGRGCLNAARLRLKRAMQRSTECLEDAKTVLPKETATFRVPRSNNALQQMKCGDRNSAGLFCIPLPSEDGEAVVSSTSDRVCPVRPVEAVFTPQGKQAIEQAVSFSRVAALPNQVTQPKKVNNRLWRYASVCNVQTRRPLHPELSVAELVVTPAQSTSGRLNAIIAPDLKEPNTTEEYAVCPKCGQLSKNYTRCDYCHVPFTSDIKIYSPRRLPQGQVLKRKVDIAVPTQTNSVVSKKTFFGPGLLDPANTLRILKESGITITGIPVGSTMPIVTKRPQNVRREEPECLTISSDEDEDPKGEDGPKGNETVSETDDLDIPFIPNCNATPDANIDRIDNMKDKDGCLLPLACGKNSMSCTEGDEEDDDSDEDDQIMALQCRSIRIGSFKVESGPMEVINFTKDTLSFRAPAINNPNEMVRVTLQRSDIVRVLGYYGRSHPVLFVYTTPGCGTVIRNRLRMSKRDGPFYDPGSPDETQKRITLLPVGISTEQKAFLRSIFPGNLVQEVDQKVANEILVRSTPIFSSSVAPKIPVLTSVIAPVTITFLPATMVTRSQNSVVQSQVISSPKKPIVKLLTYPPPPQTGGITITSEDLECLKQGEFLNDVIIDFYLKYLVMEKLSPEDRQRTHVFSSFFYPRLTQKTNSRNAANADTNLTLPARRHGCVKTWTRHVDIFQKDFIIIPINQSSHWFLAIVCFPGLIPLTPLPTSRDASTLDSEPSPGQSPAPSPSPSPSQSPAPSPSSRTAIFCTPVQGEDPRTPSVPDSAEAFNTLGETSMEMDESESSLVESGRSPPHTPDPEDPLPPPSALREAVGETAVQQLPSSNNCVRKEPCIMMFDSLAGPSRWRIVTVLREYLAMEWQAKKESIRVFDRDSMRGYNPRVPQQSNFSDCGVYLLQYAESFFEDPIKRFGTPPPNLESWFPEERVLQKREELRELILSLQKSQQNDVARQQAPASEEKSADPVGDEPTCSTAGETGLPS